MRLIRTGFLLCLATLLLLLSLANSDKVTLYFLPENLASLFEIKIALNIPLFLVFFSGIFIGLVIGFVWEWLREYKYRVEANNYQKRLYRAETELSELHAKENKKDDVLTLLEKVEMKNLKNALKSSRQNLWYNKHTRYGCFHKIWDTLRRSNVFRKISTFCKSKPCEKT